MRHASGARRHRLSVLVDAVLREHGGTRLSHGTRPPAALDRRDAGAGNRADGGQGRGLVGQHSRRTDCGRSVAAGFGDRADGSRLVADKNGYRDSLRGTPGWFVPIADMPVERITQAEAAHYAEFLRSIDAEVGRFVPVAAAVQRRTTDAASSTASPSTSAWRPIRKRGSPSGPACSARTKRPASRRSRVDVASLELSVDALGQPVRVFGGVRDFRTPLVVRQGEAKPAGAPEEFLSRLCWHLAAAAWCCWKRFLGQTDRPARRRRHRAARRSVQYLGSSGRTTSFCSRCSATCCWRSGRSWRWSKPSGPHRFGCGSTTCTTSKSPPASTGSVTCEPGRRRPAQAAS